MMIRDMRGLNTLTHNHNCLMGTITFKVHPITPTSPRNTVATIFKSILIIFVFFLLFDFIILGHIRDQKKKKNPIM